MIVLALSFGLDSLSLLIVDSSGKSDGGVDSPGESGGKVEGSVEFDDRFGGVDSSGESGDGIKGFG